MDFLLLIETCIFLCWGKVLQYSVENIHSFCFIVFSATLVLSIASEWNYKNNITVKNALTKNCNTLLDLTKK